jgi:hypothetical protein
MAVPAIPARHPIKGRLRFPFDPGFDPVRRRKDPVIYNAGIVPSSPSDDRLSYVIGRQIQG